MKPFKKKSDKLSTCLPQHSNMTWSISWRILLKKCIFKICCKMPFFTIPVLINSHIPYFVNTLLAEIIFKNQQMLPKVILLGVYFFPFSIKQRSHQQFCPKVYAFSTSCLVTSYVLTSLRDSYSHCLIFQTFSVKNTRNCKSCTCY